MSEIWAESENNVQTLFVKVVEHDMRNVGRPYSIGSLQGELS